MMVLNDIQEHLVGVADLGDEEEEIGVEEGEDLEEVVVIVVEDVVDSEVEAVASLN